MMISDPLERGTTDADIPRDGEQETLEPVYEAIERAMNAIGGSAAAIADNLRISGDTGTIGEPGDCPELHWLQRAAEALLPPDWQRLRITEIDGDRLHFQACLEGGSGWLFGRTRLTPALRLFAADFDFGRYPDLETVKPAN